MKYAVSRMKMPHVRDCEIVLISTNLKRHVTTWRWFFKLFEGQTKPLHRSMGFEFPISYLTIVIYCDWGGLPCLLLFSC